MIDWTKITDKYEVMQLLKQLQKIEERIIRLDEMAIVKYAIEKLNDDKSN